MKDLRKPFLMEETGDNTGNQPGLLGAAFSKVDGGDGGDGNKPPPEFTPNPLWDHLNTQYKITPPEGMNADTEIQAIEQVYTQRAQEAFKPPRLNPIVEELNQQFQKEDFKYEDWLGSQVNRQVMMNKTGKEFYSDFLKMEYKGEVSDEEVITIVEGINDSDLSLKVLDAKKLIKQRDADLQTSRQTQLDKSLQNEIVATTQSVEKQMNDLFVRTKNVTEIYGVQISEAERDSFNQTFKELIIPDPTTGVQAISLMLQSNDDLWRYAYITLNGDTKLKEALFNAKEGTKRQLFDQMKRTPAQGGQIAPGPVSNKIDGKKWKQPSI